MDDDGDDNNVDDDDDDNASAAADGGGGADGGAVQTNSGSGQQQSLLLCLRGQGPLGWLPPRLCSRLHGLKAINAMCGAHGAHQQKLHNHLQSKCPDVRQHALC